LLDVPAGKTLAYLIPAILSSRKIVISTATLNLQDQILNKEIPLIEKVLDQQVPVLCVKGRQNYLCHYRWFQYRAAMQMSLLDDPDGDRIEKWLEDTTTGDRSELAWLPDRWRCGRRSRPSRVSAWGGIARNRHFVSSTGCGEKRDRFVCSSSTIICFSPIWPCAVPDSARYCHAMKG